MCDFNDGHEPYPLFVFDRDFIEKMVKKRAVRRFKAMKKANSRTKSTSFVRKKEKPKRTKAAVQRRVAVKKWRSTLTPQEVSMRYAISTASQKHREIVRGKGRVRVTTGRPRAPKALGFQPVNYAQLLDLIPPPSRVKPIAIGEEVVFVLHKPERVDGWMRGKVVLLARHVSTNWIVVEKPWVLRAGENPFLCIDSPNVWVAPPGLGVFPLCILPNKGVYVLYCKNRDEYYVGESNDIEKRLGQHRGRKAPAWTKRWGGDFCRVKPLTNCKGAYKAAEKKEVGAIALKLCRGRMDRIYRESEGPQVRGAGCSNSQ